MLSGHFFLLFLLFQLINYLPQENNKASRATISHFDNFVFATWFKALMGTGRNNYNYYSYLNNMKRIFMFIVVLEK